jgi:hypothetical protein
MHWSLVGKCEGLRDYMEKKGDPIPWVVEVVEKERASRFKLLLE